MDDGPNICTVVTPSTRIKGGLILVDQSCAVLTTLFRHLLFECVLHFFSRLFEVAFHLIGVPLVLELTVAGRLTDARFDLALGYLRPVLDLVLLAHLHPLFEGERVPSTLDECHR